MTPFAAMRYRTGAVLNPSYLWTTTGAATDSGAATLAAGNQRISWVVGALGHFIMFRSSTAISGKTYCEFAPTSESSSIPRAFGVSESPIESVFFHPNANSGHIVGSGGCGLSTGYYNGNVPTANGAYAFAVGDRIGVAFDPATRKLWFRKNGTWISGDPAAGTGQTMTLAGGSTFYFTGSGYSCLTSSGTFQYEIYPAAGVQLSAAPSGFGPYQP